MNRSSNDVPNAVVPNPDPSIVTSEAIDRRVSNAADVIGARIDGMQKAVDVFQADLTRVPTQLDRAITSLRDLLETRIGINTTGIAELNRIVERATDKRTAEISTTVNGLHTLLSSEITALSAVTNQKFQGIYEQFKERDTRTDQRAGDTKLAVDAAFAAAKEATAKIEAGFTKSIDALQELLKATAKSSDDKIADMKERITTIEARTQGITSKRTEHREVRTNNAQAGYYVFAIVGMIFTTLIAVGTFLAGRHL